MSPNWWEISGWIAEEKRELFYLQETASQWQLVNVEGMLELRNHDFAFTPLLYQSKWEADNIS